MVRVSVHPIDGSIAQSFIERLLMFDVTICLHKEDAQRVQERYATLLEAGIANVESSHGAEMNFVFFSEENTISINDSSSVVLHDVLPSGQNKGMENAGLDSICPCSHRTQSASTTITYRHRRAPSVVNATKSP